MNDELKTELNALLLEIDRVVVDEERKNLIGVLHDIVVEYKRLNRQSDVISSYFEGYACVLKELDLAWTEIKEDADPSDQVLRTASQCARFLVDTCF